MMLAVRAFSRPRARRWLARCLALALAVSVVGLMPATKANAIGGGFENFTMLGQWSCTSNCTLSGAWGIEGFSTTCQETEAEVEVGFPADVPPTLPCHGARFSGTVVGTCVLGVCTEEGQVDFYLPDASDFGATVGPVSVRIVGTAVLANVPAPTGNESAYVLTAAFEALNNYNSNPALVWAAAGELHGGGCTGAVGLCVVNRLFTTTLTGVQAG